MLVILVTKMNPFMNLPDDVVRFELFQYLNYNDRDALNCCLPFEGRIATPLRKDANIELAVRLQVSGVKKLINTLDKNDYNDIKKRIRPFIKVFRSFHKMNYILQYSKQFREITVKKCMEYNDTNNPVFNLLSKYAKKTLIELTTDFLNNYETKYPYMYDTNRNFNSPWTSIQDRYVIKETWKSKRVI